MERENRLKSERSFEKVYIRFLNRSGRKVEIIWVNFTGQYIMYRHLKHNDYVDINSFKTHPWLALDCVTKDRMLINQSYVYYAGAQAASRRTLATVTLPLYSLRYRALLEVRNYLSNVRDVDDLDLPHKLSDELKSAITHRNTCFVLSLHRP